MITADGEWEKDAESSLPQEEPDFDAIAEEEHERQVHGGKPCNCPARPVLGGDQVAACLSVLRDATSPVSVTQIVEAVHAAGYDWERVKIRRALSYLARSGRAKCVKPGFWEVGSRVA